MTQNHKNENFNSSQLSSEKKLAQLIDQLKECKICQNQFGFEPHPIHLGEADAKILIVSQAPGWRVHERRKPFSDLSGKKLRQQWLWISEEHFYNPHLFYFTNVGHCFPGKNKNNTDKKPPRICWDKWSKHEIELLDSCELYIVIGSEAASRLFPKRKLEELVFSNLTIHGKTCFVLPHPSPLNFRWLKAHPKFEIQVLPRLRLALANALQIDLHSLKPRKEKESWEDKK